MYFEPFCTKKSISLSLANVASAIEGAVITFNFISTVVPTASFWFVSFFQAITSLPLELT